MAQYPVEDSAGIIEGVNYLLSGPTGAGQNFAGFNSIVPAYLTSYFRAPFSFTVGEEPSAEAVLWYSDPINIDTITPIDDITFEITFATAQASPPFTIGQGLYVQGTTATGSDSDFYNTYWSPPGVVTCSTTSVIVQANNVYNFPTATGGTVKLDASDDYVSTDANGRVQVYGPSDKVFVSAQIILDWDYVSDAVGSQDVYVAINRYAGFLDTSDPLNKDYLFADRTTITEQLKTVDVSSGTGSITNQQYVFTTVIDSPSYIRNGVTQGYGFYWYILELYFDSDNGSGAVVYPTTVTTSLRSLTAQVIKQ
jgi:hypothetical protein